ncbi:MAG TPA: quinone-dependent dihydroorotate dehydrogenase [Actinomycetaceae bacterium]|nr:quinone-dependent dihydroorotate dehydrogenase [Actinomycetaceae bacterium]
MYRKLYDNVLVHTDPEAAHHLAVFAIGAAGNVEVSRRGLEKSFGRRGRPVTGSRLLAFPRPFPGVVGLAAGMDKNATAVLGMDALGFGFIEVGTVTALPQPGNEKPRVWRHPDIEGLRNQMGFNNDGAVVIGERLRKLRQTKKGRAVVVGVNIGKSRATPLADAAADYGTSAREVARWADFLVVNVSSPNTPGLRELQDVEALKPILERVRAEATRVTGREVPLLVKIAPDLADDDVVRIAELSNAEGLTGVVATNTTINHDLGPGGLSGVPLRDRALGVVRILRQHLSNPGVIIGSGGIFTPEDGRAFLDAGADLLEGYTAFVYEGPGWPGMMNRALSH